LSGSMYRYSGGRQVGDKKGIRVLVEESPGSTLR
jgi:hypothetical protein